MSIKITVQTIHNRTLTSFDVPLVQADATQNITGVIQQRIEDILGIPQHLQVLLLEDQVLTDDLLQFTNLSKDTVINLGLKGTTDSQIDNIYHKHEIGRILSPTRIGAKYGSEILQFAFAFTSTVADVKLSISHKYVIPKELIVLIHRVNYENVVLLDDQFVVDLYFGPRVLRKKIFLTVMLKADGYSRFNETGITEIKPIVIFSNIKNGIEQKLITFSPQQNLYTVLDVKQSIEQMYGIPVKLQVLTIKGELLNQPESLLSYLLTSNELVLRLAVKSTIVDNVMETCRENGIVLLEPFPILRAHGETLTMFYFENGDTILDLKVFIGREYKIPVGLQVFYDGGGNKFRDKFNMMIYVRRGGRIDMRLGVKYSTNTNVNEICSKMNIFLLKAIIVTPLGSPKALGSFLLADVISLMDIKTKIKDKFGISSGYQVMSHRKKILANNNLELDSFFYQLGMFLEDVNFYLTLNPCLNKDNSLQLFCKEHDMSYLKTIAVKSLTCEVQKIDVMKHNVTCVKFVKKYIEISTLRLPIHLQELFHEKRVLKDDEEIMQLYIEAGRKSEELTLNLVIKPGRPAVINLHCDLILPESRTLRVVETDTISYVKEQVEGISGIPAGRIDVFFGYFPRLPEDKMERLKDETALHELYVGRYYNRDKALNLFIRRVVLVELHEDLQDTITLRFHQVPDWNIFTVKDMMHKIQDLRSDRQGHQKLILVNQKDSLVNDKALLRNIGDDIVVKVHVVQNKDLSCVVS